MRVLSDRSLHEMKLNLLKRTIASQKNDVAYTTRCAAFGVKYFFFVWCMIYTYWNYGPYVRSFVLFTVFLLTISICNIFDVICKIETEDNHIYSSSYNFPYWQKKYIKVNTLAASRVKVCITFYYCMTEYWKCHLYTRHCYWVWSHV